MNDPDGSAWVDGLCGDSMEMYLVIKDSMITEASFFTDGCSASRACGSAAAHLATGKSLNEALKLSPADILATLENIPENYTHCSILAVTTLFKALTDYLLTYQYR